MRLRHPRHLIASPIAWGTSSASPASPPPYRGVTRVTQTPGVQPLARLVADIAERVARLSPSHRDPEAFHMDKHTLASELRALARAMEAA